MREGRKGEMERNLGREGGGGGADGFPERNNGGRGRRDGRNGCGDSKKEH